MLPVGGAGDVISQRRALGSGRGVGWRGSLVGGGEILLVKASGLDLGKGRYCRNNICRYWRKRDEITSTERSSSLNVGGILYVILPLAPPVFVLYVLHLPCLKAGISRPRRASSLIPPCDTIHNNRPNNPRTKQPSSPTVYQTICLTKGLT